MLYQIFGNKFSSLSSFKKELRENENIDPKFQQIQAYLGKARAIPFELNEGLFGISITHLKADIVIIYCVTKKRDPL